MGFIGHHLALYLKERGLEPLVFDNFSQNVSNDWHRYQIERRRELLTSADIPIISGDTRVVESLQGALLRYKPDRIVHLSAIPSVLLSNEYPGTAIDNNFGATKNILEAIRTKQLEVKQLAFFSSSTVYGDFKTPTVTEESPTNPKGIYEAAKLSSELIIRAYHNLLGLPYTILRPSALYGERCINNRVTQIFIEKAIVGEPLRIEGAGSERLDFTYIQDLARGVYLSLTREEALNQTINLTYGEARQIQQLIDCLKAYFPGLTVEHAGRDRMKPMRGTLDITRARELLKYSPAFPLEEGYPRYIEWYLKSPFRDLVAGKPR